jgi:DNA mismatch endonuclease (patch repair protein)
LTDNLSNFHGLTRSQLMGRIRSRGNKKTELAMLSLLRAHKIWGWRRHQSLPGRPDFVFRHEGVALFVDGCFWHGCPRHYKAPKTRDAFWSEKVATNRRRDLRVTRELRKAGWKVVRVWECDLNRTRRPRVLKRLLRALNSKIEHEATKR